MFPKTVKSPAFVHTRMEEILINGSNYHLAGRSVLCVGGRSKLYPAYNHLIENSGGNLMTFHGDPNDHLDHLPQLLEKADIIVTAIMSLIANTAIFCRGCSLDQGCPAYNMRASNRNRCVGINNLLIKMIKSLFK